MGQILFYTANWKIVSYADLKPVQLQWKQVKEHQAKIVDSCAKVKNETWYHLTDCHAFAAYMRSKIKYTEQLKDIVIDYLSPNSFRTKRGIIDFGGDVLKFLFGTLTQSDAKEYNQHINELEKEQKEFLHISKEQMTVLKSAITSFNITMQKVDRNEKLLANELKRLNKLVVTEMNKVHYELDSVIILNENIRRVQRGLIECQHTFEILVEAFLHAQDGVIQPQLITMVQIKSLMRKESLPDGLEFPSFPSIELSKLINPIIYSQGTFLVYVIQLPLIHSNPYHLYKVQPFPAMQQPNVFVYIESSKDFIFVDAMRQRYGKMNYPDLQACMKPNELTFVCKETIPILTYNPNEDCESTLIHPSTAILPKGLCNQRILNLEQTYWIPLYLSNEWLYTAPTDEIFTVLCGTEKFQLKLQGRGKLHLPPRCKGYSTHTTLYAISTIVRNNSQDDVLPIASIELDCCLTIQEKDQLSEIPLNKPLSNILSSVEDLNIASVKIDEIQEMIHEQEKKKFEYLSLSFSTWASVMLSIVVFITCVCCSCCCCKCCRQVGFWLWDKWTPKECLKQTRERCCIINNFNADHINYAEIPSPPGSPTSIRSLPSSLTKAPTRITRSEATRRRSSKQIEKNRI
jgi:hypothetical protein